MSTSRSSRCCNALYVYGEDLLRVWSVWGAPIMTYSMIQVKNCVNLQLPLWALTVNPSVYHAGFASLWPLAAVAGAETHYIYMNLIFYEYEVCRVPQYHNPSEKPRESPTTYYCLWLWDPAYQAGVESWWLPAAVEDAETHYMCMEKTWWEYEVCGVPQS
jgi:hypothetical protein